MIRNGNKYKPFIASKNDVLVKGEWSLNNVIVSINGVYNPNNVLKQYIHDTWSEYTSKHTTSFDSGMLGLGDFFVNKNHLTLNTYSTKYSEYIGTRNTNFSQQFPGQKRADIVGMTIVPITSDDKVMVTRRSLTMEQNPGTLYFMGGYVDVPSDTKISPNIGEHVARELREEFNVTYDHNDTKIYGIGYDPKFSHPELYIRAKLCCSSEELVASWKIAQDGREADEVFFYKEDELKNVYKNNSLPYSPSWSFEMVMQVIYEVQK